jgi:signal transduction histidine kinase
LALAIAGTLRDLRTPGYDGADVLVDWCFIGLTVLVGRLVHRRSARAEELDEQLQVARLGREEQIRRAVAEERAVIARELHDIVAHGVSLMVVQAGTARPMAQRRDPELADVLGTIEQAGRNSLIELRRLLQVLRSPTDSHLHPVPDLSRLDELVEGFRRAGQLVDVTWSIPADVPSGIALCAYRAVQEGLTNAMRHAPGARVEVEVVGHGTTLSVLIRDHGGGAGEASPGTGTGLVGLRERVQLCGGRMTCGPDGTGWRLECLLPLSEAPVLTSAPSARPEPA